MSEDMKTTEEQNILKDDAVNQDARSILSEHDGPEGGETDGNSADTQMEEAVGKEEAAGSGDDPDTGERYCYVCRRPESRVGKLFDLPGGLTICPDCMQRTFDMVGKGSMGNMQFPPNMIISGSGSIDDMLKELEKLNPALGGGHSMKINPVKKPPKDHQKKQEKKEKPALTLKNLPAPHQIKAQLDEYVIGQEKAKKSIAVAVYNHYKRVLAADTLDIEIQKSNMLMIGPTGCGKTYIVQTLAKMLDVPLAIADATSLTEAGYIGDDIESVLSKLLAAAGDDVEKAEKGIVFIDEIDKLAKKRNANSRDVSGESVQQGLLKLLEGSVVEVPVGATSKNAMVPLVEMNTKNILFICGGAFPDLTEVIKERLRKTASMGFGAQLKDEFEHDENLLSQVTTEDLRAFGMIPEFLGRLPIVFTLSGMTKDMLVRILKEPKNAIIKQYQALLSLDEVKLEFEDDALELIAEQALKKDTGARALRAIIEEYMLDIMYEIPKDPNIGAVTITKDYLEHKGGPLISVRGNF
jgi:ATP-dependent Clp protease ATP-binding subunit ClpX